MIMFWQKTGYVPVLGLLLILYIKTVHTHEEDNICVQSDPGTTSSCPDVGLTTFEVNWNPQNITGDHEYDVTIVRLDIPKGAVLDSGSAHVTIWIPFLDPPLFNKTLPFNCTDVLDNIRQQFPNKTIPVTCPIKGPFKLPFPYPIPGLKAPTDIPVPMGSYHVRAEVFNAKETTPFVCLDGWLIFAKVHKDYESCKMSSEPNVNPEALQFNYDNEHIVFRKDQL